LIKCINVQPVKYFTKNLNFYKTSFNPLNKHKYKSFLNKSFNTYTNISLFSQTKTLKPHYSFYSFFIKNHNQNSSYILNISKFYNKYINTLTFVINTFYYRLDVVFFGNTFFKNEILSMNWLFLTKYNINLRLNQLLLFVNPLNRSVLSTNILKQLLQVYSINAFIYDVLLHSTTINLLHKLNVVTLGTVPITYNAKTLDIVIPVSTDSIFSQFFVLQLTSKVRKIVEYNRYKESKQLYLGFVNN